MTAPLDYRKVAATNRAVEIKKVEQAIAIRKVIQTAGLRDKEGYRIAPPLGPSHATPKPSHALAVRPSRAR